MKLIWKATLTNDQFLSMKGKKNIPQSQHMETILMVLTCRCIRSVRQKSLFTAYIVNLQNSPNNADHKTQDCSNFYCNLLNRVDRILSFGLLHFLIIQNTSKHNRLYQIQKHPSTVLMHKRTARCQCVGLQLKRFLTTSPFFRLISYQ